MHIFFSGIGGTGMASLALIAQEAGYEVSGSDARPSQYLDYLREHGVTDTHIGVDRDFIAETHQKKPIDWYVFGSAQPMDFPDHPEFGFCRELGIKMSKLDEFLSQFLKEKDLKLIAVAGTHGKSTTTAMATWVFKKLGLPVSYSGGAKLSFGDLAQYDPNAKYFVYEADEYDRKFLSFYPGVALISGLDYDHPDIYPTRQSYEDAFREFFEQSNKVVLWQSDAERLGLDAQDKFKILDDSDATLESIKLPGLVNRKDAWLVANGLAAIAGKSAAQLIKILNEFPGLSRRFEQIAPNVYSDYAHTPPKIRGALQLAHEVAGANVVVIYEGLHNTRQHFIKDELATLFNDVKQLYIVPSYLAREDKSLELLTPEKLLKLLNTVARSKAAAIDLNDDLQKIIKHHTEQGDLVLCLSAGGAGSLDEWLRHNFAS